MKQTKWWLLFIIVVSALLRIPYLDHFPPALYSDEVSQGYNAYSILRTGQDEYETFLPISLRSFGDWKPPIPTYAMVPTVALFGLNAWGVRLPSAIFGVATVFLTYFLTMELLRHNKNVLIKQSTFQMQIIALITSMLLAISPWHIAQSRSAMLVSVELFFFVLTLLGFLKGFKNYIWWYVASFSLAMAVYSYYAMRLIVPIVVIVCLWWFRKNITKNILRVWIGPLIVGLVLFTPLIIGFIQQPDVVFGRAKTVSVFYDQGVALTVWDLIAQDGIGASPRLTQFFHNKPYHYAADIVRRFFQHFDSQFLFLTGDKHPPFQIPGMGILYVIDSVFLLIGGIYLLRSHARLLLFLVLLIGISIIPASLTFVTPTSNRTFTMIVPLYIIAAFGLWIIAKKKKVMLPVIALLYCLSGLYFGYNYTKVLSQSHADWWHFGYQELYDYLHTQESNSKTIALSSRLSVPYIFLLFYQKVDPKMVNETIHRNYNDDEFGFEHVDSFGQYRFFRDYSWQKDGERLPKSSLLVLRPSEEVGASAEKIHEIVNPDGKTAYIIYRIN